MSSFSRKVGRITGVSADLKTVRRALAVLADQEQGIQLHYAPFRQHTFATFPGSDLDSQVDWVQRHQDASGIYYCLNPVPLTLTTNVESNDVIRRHRLLIDVDRDKTIDPKASATDLEHEAAKIQTWAVSDFLTECGWPAPIIVDSGNGWHIVHTIDLPNNDETTDLIQTFLDALDFKFPGPCKIGTECHDARRVAKLPGTWARRGVETSERPYRMAKLAELPAILEAVHPDLIRETIEKISKPNASTETPQANLNGSTAQASHSTFRRLVTNRGNADVETRAIAYLATIPGGTEGENGSKPMYWAARCMVHGFNLGIDRGFEILREYYSPRCTPPWPDYQIRHKCDDAYKDPFDKPRGWLVNESLDGSARSNAAPAPKPAPKQTADTPKIWRLPQLLAENIPPPRWAVPGLMSEGLTILAGKPKLGKSWLALNLALTIAAGGKALTSMPDVEPGDVLYLALEDRLRRVQDRANKLLKGIGCVASERLHIAIDWPRQHQGGLELIQKWMESVVRPTLVIIDVWAKFRTPMKNQGSQYEQDYETASQVKALGDEHSCSLLPLHHCKKAAAEDAVDEISGTLGLAGAADGTLILTRCRGENDANLFMTGRDIDENNLALVFDPTTCCWKSEGDAKERTESKLKLSLIDLFKRNAGSILTGKDIGDRLNISDERRNVLRVSLARMVDEGLIERCGSGRFRWPISTPEEVPK